MQCTYLSCQNVLERFFFVYIVSKTFKCTENHRDFYGLKKSQLAFRPPLFHNVSVLCVCPFTESDGIAKDIFCKRCGPELISHVFQTRNREDIVGIFFLLSFTFINRGHISNHASSAFLINRKYVEM